MFPRVTFLIESASLRTYAFLWTKGITVFAIFLHFLEKTFAQFKIIYYLCNTNKEIN